MLRATCFFTRIKAIRTFVVVVVAVVIFYKNIGTVRTVVVVVVVVVVYKNKGRVRTVLLLLFFTKREIFFT